MQVARLCSASVIDTQQDMNERVQPTHLRYWQQRQSYSFIQVDDRVIFGISDARVRSAKYRHMRSAAQW